MAKFFLEQSNFILACVISLSPHKYMLGWGLADTVIVIL